MLRILTLLLALLTQAAVSTARAATPARAASSAIDPALRRAIVDSVATLVERHYVVPDTGRMIADRVRARERDGAYADAANLPDLAALLTTDLRSVNGDWHLTIRFDSAFAASLAGSGDRASTEAERMLAERARKDNFGVHRVERLPGNVGYLKMGIFYDAPDAFDRVEHALRLLEGTDAVILDLRTAPGGSDAMANFLISHFTEPNRPSLRVYWRPEDRTTVRRTLAEVPGPRRTGVPLYVLTSRRSASAAEDVAFVLQNFGRATVVGETTAGAGRNNRFFPVGHGLAVSISVSRVQDPATGREWEQVGVKPDVAVPAEEALDAALEAERRDALSAVPR